MEIQAIAQYMKVPVDWLFHIFLLGQWKQMIKFPYSRAYKNANNHKQDKINKIDVLPVVSNTGKHNIWLGQGEGCALISKLCVDCNKPDLLGIAQWFHGKKFQLRPRFSGSQLVINYLQIGLVSCGIISVLCLLKEFRNSRMEVSYFKEGTETRAEKCGELFCCLRFM